MVNTTIISQFSDGHLPVEGGNREIPNGPLYPAEEVLDLLSQLGADAIRLWTRKCTADAQKWGFDSDDLCELVSQAVRVGRFRLSEWCVQHPDGPWAACDSYSFVRREPMPNAPNVVLDVEYYLKYAIARTERVLLVASCHPTEHRN